MLSMPTRSERLAALGTLEAGGMPVLTHRCLLLREVDLLLTPRALRHDVVFRCKVLVAVNLWTRRFWSRRNGKSHL